MIWSRLFLYGTLAGVSTRGAVSQVPAITADTAALHRSVDQLREHRGQWNVESEFLNPDNTAARRVAGPYRFDWAQADRILVGVAETPGMRTAAGILFYVSAKRGVIEMVSVGSDGTLWTMTGALGGEVRQTQPYRTQDGGEGRLRFTRFNVTPSAFESRMEYSEDGGKRWLPGNHQTFLQAAEPGPEFLPAWMSAFVGAVPQERGS